MGDPVDDFFARAKDHHESKLVPKETHYPGSRRELPRSVPSQRATAVLSDWDDKPIFRLVNGRKLELFTVNHMAKALGRKTDAVRKMIKFGYVPQSPYRSSGYAFESGEAVLGNRLYTRRMVESLVILFAKYHLIEGTKRMRWSDYPTLPLEIQDEWTRQYDELSSIAPVQAVEAEVPMQTNETDRIIHDLT